MGPMVVSTHEIRTYQRCREEYRFAYALGVKPVREEEPLVFGRVFHRALETWWGGRDPIPGIRDERVDPFMRASVEALMLGYSARWGADDLEVISLEKYFSIVRENYVLEGYVDAIVRTMGVKVMEHKTTSDDISPGSDYWHRLSIDDQVTNYYSGVRSLGYEVEGCLYDVTAKPTLEPKKATPPEKRKYTQKTGQLYANQRAEDETPDEYRDRIIEDIEKDPDSYFGRVEVVRLEEEEVEARRHMRILVDDMARVDPEIPEPKNTGSCRRYGRPCPYLPVCTKSTDLFDPRYRHPTQARLS